jgi:transcriptional regulator with XRE-family HTH domain
MPLSGVPSPTSALDKPQLRPASPRSGASDDRRAFRASIHRTEVSLLERGERMPRVDTALRIAGSLGVPLDDLVAGLEWRPGYEIVVPGSWEIVERNGRVQNPDEPAAKTPAPAEASEDPR